MTKPKQRERHKARAATLLCVVLCVSISAVAVGLDKEVISGSWTIRQHVNDNFLTEQTYSWGEGISVRNGSIDIDLGAEEPWLQLGYLGGVFPVRSVEQVAEQQFRIEFWFSRGGFAVVWLAQFLDRDRVFFEQIDGELSILGIFGPENVHHRIDGPEWENPPGDCAGDSSGQDEGAQDTPGD